VRPIASYAKLHKAYCSYFLFVAFIIASKQIITRFSFDLSTVLLYEVARCTKILKVADNGL
jgi:TRAP-type C4-dicarboxylate transport system permease small subunit